MPDIAPLPTTSTPTWSPAKPVSGSSKPGELSKDDFLNLLVAQLKYQNPLAPTDPTAFMQQSTQLATMERLEELASTTTKLLTAEQTRSASDLIGQTVTWKSGDNEVSGVVASVRLGGTEPLLTIGDKQVALGAVLDVARTPATPVSTPTTPPAEES